MTGISDLHSMLMGTDKLGKDTAVASRPSQNTAAATDSSLLSGDRTAVSTAGASLGAALDTSDVRADKVAALQAAIQGGNYNISSSQLADSLISSMLRGPITGRG